MPTATIEMVRKKDCKHSVAYEVPPGAVTAVQRPCLAGVYLMRSFATEAGKAPENMPDRIRVTVEELK